MPVVRFARPTRSFWAIGALAGLFLISLALRSYFAVALHFDGLYGQDPYAYYSYGQQVQDAIAHLRLPGHFYWPLGYPALVALGFAFTGNQPLGPQLISLITGAFVSIFVLLLTVEIALQIGADRRRAWIAGLAAWAVTAICGQLIQSSFVIMSDAPALMWATLSAWALTVYSRSRRPGWIALAAFALAWATMTRWQYGGLALPWAIYVLLNRPFRFRHAVIAVIVGLITLTPQIAHTIQNPDPLFSHMWLQGWSPTNAFAHQFTTADGTFAYDQGPAWYYAQPLYNVYYMSPLLLPFLALGLVGLIRADVFSLPLTPTPSPRKDGEGEKRGKVSLILLIGWFAVQYGFLAGIPYENIRFALAIVPPIAVLVGIGAGIILTTQRLPLLIRVAAILVIVYSLSATWQATLPIVNNFVAAKNADLAATEWIAAQITEPDATVYCLDLLLTAQHYTTLRPVQIYDLTPDELSSQLPSHQPAYAVFNVWTTEHQWQGKSPWIIYHWLLNNPRLFEIGTFGNYTLYRIGLG